MYLNEMIFPGQQIEEFIIRDEISQSTAEKHPDAFVLTSANIIRRIKSYDQVTLSYHEIVYVKTARRGYWKGFRLFGLNPFSNDSINNGKISYCITEIFQTRKQVNQDILYEEKSHKDIIQHLIATRQPLLCIGPYSKQIIIERDMIETYNISVEIVAPVEFLSANPVIIDRQTAHITNNLHLKLDIVARELCCTERWYKHDGKIFRAIHYAANYFALVYHGEHIEANQLTNSELILKDSNGYGEPPSPMQMKAKRLWIVDTTQPGISRSQYKRQKRRQQITSAHLATFFEESVRDITCQELEKQLPPWKRAN